MCGSELHIARPVMGSRDRDLSLLRLGSVAGVVVEARDPSDLALTNRSIAGSRF